jgi:hypothetical protein
MKKCGVPNDENRHGYQRFTHDIAESIALEVLTIDEFMVELEKIM